MERETLKVLVLSLVLSLVILEGFLFLGKGITGMYLLDFSQPYCEKESDCKSTEVCCRFYQEDAGICDQVDKCKAIERLTQEEKSKITSSMLLAPKKQGRIANFISMHVERPSEPKDGYISIGVGVFLLLLGIFWVLSLKKSG